MCQFLVLPVDRWAFWFNLSLLLVCLNKSEGNNSLIGLGRLLRRPDRVSGEGRMVGMGVILQSKDVRPEP